MGNKSPNSTHLLKMVGMVGSDFVTRRTNVLWQRVLLCTATLHCPLLTDDHPTLLQVTYLVTEHGCMQIVSELTIKRRTLFL